MFSNVRSILNKRDELLAEVLISKPDIIGITETWIHSEISDSEIQIPGYSVFRQDRLDTVNGRGGGVLLFVKAGFICIDRTDQFSFGFSNCLSVCVVSFQWLAMLIVRCMLVLCTDHQIPVLRII